MGLSYINIFYVLQGIGLARALLVVCLFARFSVFRDMFQTAYGGRALSTTDVIGPQRGITKSMNDSGSTVSVLGHEICQSGGDVPMPEVAGGKGAASR